MAPLLLDLPDFLCDAGRQLGMDAAALRQALRSGRLNLLRPDWLGQLALVRNAGRLQIAAMAEDCQGQRYDQLHIRRGHDDYLHMQGQGSEHFILTHALRLALRVRGASACGRQRRQLLWCDRNGAPALRLQWWRESEPEVFEQVLARYGCTDLSLTEVPDMDEGTSHAVWPCRCASSTAIVQHWRAWQTPRPELPVVSRDVAGCLAALCHQRSCMVFTMPSRCGLHRFSGPTIGARIWNDRVQIFGPGLYIRIAQHAAAAVAMDGDALVVQDYQARTLLRLEHQG